MRIAKRVVSYSYIDPSDPITKGLFSDYQSRVTTNPNTIARIIGQLFLLAGILIIVPVL